jgi:hypothetical protein
MKNNENAAYQFTLAKPAMALLLIIIRIIKKVEIAPCMFVIAMVLPKNKSPGRLKTVARAPKIFMQNAAQARNAVVALTACAPIWLYGVRKTARRQSAKPTYWPPNKR